MHLKFAPPIGIVVTGDGIFNSIKTYFELVVNWFSAPKVLGSLSWL